jgi:hypothetical protein
MVKLSNQVTKRYSLLGAALKGRDELISNDTFRAFE